MEKEAFQIRLDTATQNVVDWTLKFCNNKLANNYKYIINPSVRIFDNHLTEKEIENLKRWNKYQKCLLSAKQVIELLLQEGRVPLWINISVIESRRNLTVIELLCSRRLRNENELYHQNEIPPFHVLCPIPPWADENFNTKYFEQKSLKSIIWNLKYKDYLKTGKFDINWQIKPYVRLWRIIKFFEKYKSL